MAAEPAIGLSEALFAGLRERQAPAQRQFWAQFWPVVRAVSLRILGDDFAANEVSSEVMYEFMSKYVHQLSCPQAARTYLQLMTARRSAKERVRRARHVGARVDELADLPNVTAEDRSLYGLLQPRLEICLKKLTPKAQQIVKLRFFADMTNEEIGGVVGDSKQYIGRLLTQVMGSLKKCLMRAGRGPAGGAS